MYRLLLFSLILTGCKITQPTSPPPQTEPGGTILTIIFKIDPRLDTLTVYDIIRAPGRLRTDYGPVAEAGPEDLLFTFQDATGRTLRQTAQPYPPPNRYEGPGEDGSLQTRVLPDEPRSLVLKTHANRRIHRLSIRGTTPNGATVVQSIGLQSDK